MMDPHTIANTQQDVTALDARLLPRQRLSEMWGFPVTQEKLANILGVAKSTVTAWENKYRTPERTATFAIQALLAGYKPDSRQFMQQPTIEQLNRCVEAVYNSPTCPWVDDLIDPEDVKRMTEVILMESYAGAGR